MSVPAAMTSSIAALALAALTACGSSSAIPANAQRVRVTVTQSEVRVEPASVSAGDVYLVLEGPILAAGFVQQARRPDATPGPLSDADLTRLAQGDWQFTATEMMEVTCNPEQREAMRGLQGPCGNVFKVVVAPGRYAIVHGRAQTTPQGGPIMAVLQVEPSA